MKKEKLYYTILIILFLTGTGLLIWALNKVDNYPAMRELKKEAMATVKPQYFIGLILLCAAYTFSYMKGLFK